MVNRLGYVPNLGRLLTEPLAKTCSAANTTPPHLGQPLPGGALIMAVSITVVLGAASLIKKFISLKNNSNFNRKYLFKSFFNVVDLKCHILDYKLIKYFKNTRNTGNKLFLVII